jgi:dipeptidyl aminopeptidase/acylaminoacyl peptidase
MSTGCQERRQNPKGRLTRPVRLGLGAVIVGAGLAFGTLAYAYLATHPRRIRVRKTPRERGLDYEDIAFPAADGTRLSGWLIPADHKQDLRAVVVLCHGYPYNRTEMLPYAEFLHQAGFTTLLFDFRAMGESQGDLCSVGHHEVQDLRGALDYLAGHPQMSGLPIGALGLSLGGAVSIMTAARDTRLQAVVAEASFPTLDAALNARCRAILGPFGPSVAHPIRWWAKRWFPVSPLEVAPIREIPQIGPRAVLLIQGQRDLQVRWQDSVAMYEAAREPREIWLLPRSGHARCLADAPDEYARRVAAFFQKHLVEV